MSRFYIPRGSIKGKMITISGSQAHHILDVMRLKRLDKVVTFDGTGVEYVGFIKDAKPKSLTVEVISTRKVLKADTPKITLIQAIPKKERMDYIVEKATELGASSIMPVVTSRTIPDWNESKKASHVERWCRIAMEASKQCGRADVPTVGAIKDFKDVIKSPQAYELGLIAALSDESIRLKEALTEFKAGTIAVAIGPEGDFTTEEVTTAKEAGFRLVNLGPRVLRSDTAGLAVLSVINYEFHK